MGLLSLRAGGRASPLHPGHSALALRRRRLGIRGRVAPPDFVEAQPPSQVAPGQQAYAAGERPKRRSRLSGKDVGRTA